MTTEKQRLGYVEGWLSAIVNTVLFGFKLWAGMSLGSIAMIADAWHTLSDTLTSAVVLFGFWIAGKPKDKEHPFGHGRAELVSAIIIGTLLAVVGLNFLQDSYEQLRNHHAVTFKLIGILVFVLSILLKEALAQFSIWAGKKINSQALLADGWHHRSDAIASALIVVGGLFGAKFWWIDGVLGLGVSLLIIYAAFSIIKDAADSLLGEPMTAELEQQIFQVVQETAPETSELHHTHVHRYGDHTEVTFHIRLNAAYPLHQAHAIVTTIEQELRRQLHIEPTIHAEPTK
ncbi:MAG: cation transporter [Anaerolineae bacterium]|nr:cation transporter [Anaerolineae bacterium]